ncbi:MAG TPA: precorrin-6y C5,15-methyltransferase (decarboxylating) subunit CbiE [bacterium]|nr:precorrin-6y C5,15-methyltransferase (decarboxylating) subunit CbiE [bacterium]
MRVIGVSDGGLDKLAPGARQELEAASFLAGGERQLAFCAAMDVKKLVFKGDLKGLAERLGLELEAPGARPVVLASGDPLFYGVGQFLIQKLGADRVEVLPSLSSMQLAFARAGLKWDDAFLVSVHGRPLDKLAALPPDCRKVGVFTDPDNDPGAVAEYLMRLGWDAGSAAWVAENIDGPDEKLTRSSLGELAGLRFGELNVVVAQRAQAPGPREAYAFGLDEADFAQRKPEKGLITKAEVRALSLSKLRLFPGALTWDIGAATGSVAIEAARLSRGGRVWAVEKNADDCENVRENVRRFSTPSVLCLHGEAPAALSEIPAADAPDAVFVGGTAGRMDAILDACLARLKPGGVIVLNTVTVENTAEALAWYGASGMRWDFLQVQVSRGKAIKTPSQSLHRLDALNPVTIFWGDKPPASPPDAV